MVSCSRVHSRLGHVYVKCGCPQAIFVRKRRRQNYHSKVALKGKLRRGRKDEEWDEKPAKARRQIWIEDKLKAVRLYNELKKSRDEAAAVARERIPRNLTNEEREAFLEHRAKAKDILKRNLQKEVERQLPNIVRTCHVHKWAKQAEDEKWELLPASDRSRLVEVPKAWRQKFALPAKGRPVGGFVPEELQKDLDRIIAEHVLGQSEVTERKEVVTWRDIDPRI